MILGFLHPRWKDSLASLFYVFNGLPQLFSFIPSFASFGLISFNWYENSVVKYSQERWCAPHNLWRQPFHALVTIGLALVLIRSSALSDLTIITVCFLYGLIKEIWEFRKDQKWSKPDRREALKKSLSDVVSYTLAGAITCLLY